MDGTPVHPEDTTIVEPALPPPAVRSYDGRPPGGTARATGPKTPRRVQWAAENRVDLASPSAHGLDLHARDPEAFEALKDALERASSSSSTTRGRSLTHSSDRLLSARATTADRNRSRSPSREHREPTSSASRIAHSFPSITIPQFFRTRDSSLSRSNDSIAAMMPEEDLEMGIRTNYEGTGVKRGGGVLSTLLGLYSTSGSGASTPSFDASRTSSRLPSPVRTRPDEANHSNGTGLGGPSVLKTVGSSGSMASVTRGLYDTRPSQARNAGGVFGTLIASTASLTGPAAPTASTLAPSVKRPGYHISRYSLQELPTRQKMKGTSPTLSRPRSTNFDEPKAGGSGSYHSALVDSPGSGTTSGTQTATESPSVADAYAASTSSSTTLPSSAEPARVAGRKQWTFSLGDLPAHPSFPFHTGMSSSGSTPAGTPASEQEHYFDEQIMPGRKQAVGGRKKRKRAQIYITRHVEEIVRRQEFILKFVRALIMFGAPSHRMQSQILSTARVLDVEMSCFYLPDAMLISFEDTATGTSNVKFVRQGSALNINKLQEVHEIYWNVIHDELSVKEASLELDRTMREKAVYKWWQLVLVGSLCSAAICSVSFYGSFIDCLAACVLGAILVTVQLRSAHHELYSHIFELSIATLLSFIAAALGSTGHFCYSAVASGAVVLILPGYIVLCGSLDITSRNTLSGAVRLCFALMYSLFLGFGLAIGAVIFQAMRHSGMLSAELDDYQCVQSHHADGVWWQQTPSEWWAFLTVPLYSVCLSLRFHASYKRKEFILLIAISCVGWVTTHFASLAFNSRSDISAAVGAFTIGLIANIYGRLFNGNAFVVMITGILFQVPSGLGNGGGLLAFVSQQNDGAASTTTDTYVSGFQTALQLISVAVGLTVGLCTSLVVVHPVLSRRRAGGIFSL